jgi:spermidine/putrescine transport system permease protein
MKKRFTQEELFFFKAVPAFVWQLVFFGIPIIFLIFLSFIRDTSQPISLHNFTLTFYQQLFAQEYVWIVFRSLYIATVTALMCLLVGYPLTYYIALKKRRWKNFFLFFLVLPFVTNLLVLTYAWTFLLDKDGLVNRLLLFFGLIHEPILMLNSFFAIMLVMFYCYLPFMIMPLFTSLEKFDLTLIEASHDLGATRIQTFFKIILPLTWPAIQTGILLVFVPAFGEFVIPQLMGGDKYMFVGSAISHFFLIGQDRSLGAAFTLLTSIFLANLVGLFIWFFSGKEIITTKRNERENF